MRINKKILAGITVTSMLTCGIWMESVFAADTFNTGSSAEAQEADMNSPEMFSAEETVSDITADSSEESQTGTITGENPETSTTENSGFSPENRSEISETPGISDIPNTSETTTDTSETPGETELPDISNNPGTPEETTLPENGEPEISQETLPDAQETQSETTFEDSEPESKPSEEKNGFCGAEENTVSWSLDENGVLEIAGQGDMKDWENEEEVPWNGYRDQITEVRIKEGVTSIGAYAFADCENLTELDIADSVQTIGAFAYFNCSGLSALTIG